MGSACFCINAWEQRNSFHFANQGRWPGLFFKNGFGCLIDKSSIFSSPVPLIDPFVLLPKSTLSDWWTGPDSQQFHKTLRMPWRCVLDRIVPNVFFLGGDVPCLFRPVEDVPLADVSRPWASYSYSQKTRGFSLRLLSPCKTHGPHQKRLYTLESNT
jgi:hypothetical protein